MSTEPSDAAARAQQALEQLQQAVQENPDAVKQAATDAVASLRESVANLSVRQKADLAGKLRDLRTFVADSDLKQQLDALIAQVNQPS
jgi:hypothetical protein